MAQVENVILSIGNTNVAGPRPETVLTPLDTRRYRTVTINATLKFATEEMGLKYRLYAALFATDRMSEDPDDGEPTLFFDEDSGITNLANMADSNSFNLFRKSYKDIVVDNLVMPITLSKPVLYDTLNEDPKVDFGGRIPDLPPFIHAHQDELFARVWLSVVAESPIVDITLF